MPDFDGTGPRGEGPLTGCGRGYCIIPLSPEQEICFFETTFADDTGTA